MSPPCGSSFLISLQKYKKPPKPTKNTGKSFRNSNIFSNFAIENQSTDTSLDGRLRLLRCLCDRSWLWLIYLLNYIDMELQGKIIAALPPKSGTSARGEWKAQDFVIETVEDRFPRKMVFSVFGEDRLQRFNIQVGQDVTVSFDIDAHEYQGRWYNSIRAFDVRPIVQQPFVPQADAAPFSTAAAAPVAPPPPAASDDPFGGGGNASDDLPF